MRRQHPQLRWLFAVPNAAKRTHWEAAYLLREGMQSGVWDMCLPYPMHNFGALWIEHKHGTNRLSDEQRAFGYAMTEAGNACAVSRSFETSRLAITSYLAGTFDQQNFGGW